MDMVKGIEGILLFSENAKALAEFYRDKVGLEMTTEAEVGEEYEKNFFGFEFGEEKTGLYIMDHSEVHGKQKEPARIMFNLEVDNIEEEVKKMDEAGVKKIQGVYHMQGYGHIATFEDIDGNYFQLVQIRPTP